MNCERIAHPYLDPLSGTHKHVGTTGTGDISCALLNVFSNLPQVPIAVSPVDDNGDGDGLTDFCRVYAVTGPVVVTLVAPPAAGPAQEWMFRKWVIDGADQPLGQLQVNVLVGDGECHVAYAKYGNIIIVGDPESPCGDLEFGEVCTISGSVSYSLLPGADAGAAWWVSCRNACWAGGVTQGAYLLVADLSGACTASICYLRLPDPWVWCTGQYQCCPPNCEVVCFRGLGQGVSDIWGTSNSGRAFVTVGGCSCDAESSSITLLNIGIGKSGAFISRRLWPSACGPFNTTCDTGAGGPTLNCGAFMGTYVKIGPGGNCPINAQQLLNSPFIMQDQRDFNPGFPGAPATVRRSTALQVNF